LIEKHRNGPVGKVELYFDEKTTTFLDLDKNMGAGFSETSQKSSFGVF